MNNKHPKSLKVRVIALLIFMTVTLYLSVELCLFISDQYVFYSAVTEQGLPYYTRVQKSRYKNLTDEEKGRFKLAQKKAATLESATNLVRITIGLITTLIVGYISDRFGRRVAIGILLIGEALHIALVSLIVLLKLNLWLILLPGLFEAIFGGGLLSLFAQVAAILVDICRTGAKNEETVEKAQSSDRECGYGSPIGGALIYRFGFPAAMFTSLALVIPSLILIFCLPETNMNRGKKKITEVGFVSDITNNDPENEDIRSIAMEFDKSLKSRIANKFRDLKSLDPVLITIMSMVLLGSIAALADLQYVAVYLMGPPFLWSPEHVGLYSGITDVTATVISVVFTIIIIKLDEKRKARAKADEEQRISSQDAVEIYQPQKHYTRQLNLLVAVFAVSLIMLIINRSVVGVAHRFQLPTANILVYVAAVPRLMKSFCVPLVRTMFSICTHPSKQGMIQSVGAFVSRIGLLISLTVLPAIYAATVLIFQESVFIVVVILITVTLIIDLCVPFIVRRENAKLKSVE
ncbi:unnamed protein product [Heterobilharzia americana]|nr:unnamed protein product [Heterobilharzia americana]